MYRLRRFTLSWEFRAFTTSVCFAALFGSMLLLAGCDKNTSDTVDPRGNPPQTMGYSLSPAGVKIDTVAPVAGLYPVSTTVSAHVGDPDGVADLVSVTATAYDPNGNVVVEQPLHDDGISPDLAANDGVFSGTVTMVLSSADVGNYLIVVNAVDRKGIAGSNALQTFSVFHPSPPWLTGLVAPDTVVIPPGGDQFILVSVAAHDSAGLSDIKDVYLHVPEGSAPTTAFHLLDDGKRTDGDTTAGDGRYSIVLHVSDSPTVRKLYSLRLQAIDRAGDTSATLVHYLLMK